MKRPDRRKSDFKPRTICIALDSSEYCDYAFDWTMNNVLRPGLDNVILLNVRPILPISESNGILLIHLILVNII